MNEELKKKLFSGFTKRKRRPELESTGSNLSFKEIILSLGAVFGAILGTLIMIAALVGIIVAVVFGLKTLIRVLQS